MTGCVVNPTLVRWTVAGNSYDVLAEIDPIRPLARSPLDHSFHTFYMATWYKNDSLK